jgi:glycosyltransferase involved in cell wall biosynthesis
LKILILSSYDVGGASIAAFRLHQALLGAGVESKILTLHRTLTHVPQHYQYQNPPGWKNKIKLKIIQRSEHIQRNALHLPPGESLSGEFSHPLAAYDVTSSPLWDWADVVNLHWVNEWISLENLVAKAGNKALVWTMHDMHAFTGGCHYSHGCDAFEKECKECPLLARSSNPNLANHFWRLKKTALNIAHPRLFITAPSSWMASMAARSSLFGHLHVERIFNSLNTQIFKPLNQEMCREVLGLPPGKKMALSVFQSLKDRRKGFSHLIAAIQHLKDPENYVLCTVGKWNEEPIPGPVEHRHLGSIQDERLMAIVYNAADVFVHPAMEDNLPNVVVESLCCGVPVAGYLIGGMPEMVEEGKNGYLSRTIAPEHLLETLEETFRHPFSRQEIAQAARLKFGPESQAREFIRLFDRILA